MSWFQLHGLTSRIVRSPVEEGGGGGGDGGAAPVAGAVAAPATPAAPVAVPAASVVGAAAQAGGASEPAPPAGDAQPLNIAVVYDRVSANQKLSADDRAKWTPEQRKAHDVDVAALRDDLDKQRIAAERLNEKPEAKALREAGERLDALKKETPEAKAARMAAETPEQKTAREADEKLVADAAVVEREALRLTYVAVKLPDGMAPDNPVFAEFKEAALDLGLDVTAAQKLCDVVAPKLQAALIAPYEQWATLQAEWIEAGKNDPEYGGEAYEKSLGFCAKAVNGIGGKSAPALITALASTGFGNHPECVRWMYRVGRMLAEGKPRIGEPGGDEKSLAQKMYGGGGEGDAGA